MINGIKVVTIGGGSSYTPELVEGFIKRHSELPVAELWLVDIIDGAEKLKIVIELARRMVKKAGVDMKIFSTFDRREALRGADFVTTQLRVGLLDARIKDERIPLSHGVIGQETNGAGGMFKGLRTVPVILDIVKDMQELCVDAWLINFTNPAGLVTQAVLDYTDFRRVIGLCNVPVGMKKDIEKLMNIENEELDMDFAGLNHLVYGVGARINGHDSLAKIIDVVTPKNITMKNIEAKNFDADFVKSLGVIPCPYHKYYYKSEQMLLSEVEDFKKNGTRAEVVKALEADLFELYKDPNLDIKPPQLEKRGGGYYSDAACNLINSIHNNTKDIQVVNTKNMGAIPSIRYDDAVEVSCIITKEGPRPITVGHLPVGVEGLVSQIKSFEKLVAKAAITGDYNLALQAMTINPLVPSDDMAKILLDELLVAHKKYLPNFSAKIKELENIRKEV